MRHLAAAAEGEHLHLAQTALHHRTSLEADFGKAGAVGLAQKERILKSTISIFVTDVNAPLKRKLTERVANINWRRLTKRVGTEWIGV